MFMSNYLRSEHYRGGFENGRKAERAAIRRMIRSVCTRYDIGSTTGLVCLTGDECANRAHALHDIMIALSKRAKRK